MPLKVFVSAGEASGDVLGAALVEALRRRVPDLEVYGMSGPSMERAGVRRLRATAELSVVGLVEVLRHLPRLFRLLWDLQARGVAERPDVAVLVDAPDFHVRLAPAFRRAGVPTVQYVGPSVWAWRAGRAAEFSRVMSRILVLFPFELQVWRAAGADAVWVGHPMLDALPAGDPPTPERGTLALLPGSRRSEITRLFPTMLAAAARLAAEGRVTRVVVPVAPGLDPAWLARLADGFGVPITWVQAADVAGRFREVRRAEAAIVASGTATLETALAGVPHVLVYRVSPVSWWIGRRLARVRFLGLSNLLLGRQVIPELLQGECAPEPIAAAVRGLLDAPDTQRQALAEVRAALGAGGAAERAAEAVLGLVGGAARDGG